MSMLLLAPQYDTICLCDQARYFKLVVIMVKCVLTGNTRTSVLLR